VKLTGRSIIGFSDGVTSGATFRAHNPVTGEALRPEFFCASAEEVERVARLAQEAFAVYRRTSGREKGQFLRKVAANIEAIAVEVIERCGLETALPEARLRGELARTCGQLRLFAQLV